MHRLQLLAFSAARSMARHNIAGGHRLTQWMKDCGFLDEPATYRIGPVTFTVPVNLLPWARGDVITYDPATIRACAESVHRLMKDPVFVDCGAHIGIFSMLMRVACPEVREIIAIEPNPLWWEWTDTNLRALGIPATLIKGAVADFHGKGTLQAPSHSASPEAYYLTQDPGGPISVSRIDDILPDFCGDLILKLDIEGGELAALRGATDAIRRARTVLAIVEAHPQVSAATGIDPSEYARFLNIIRPFEVRALPHWVYTPDYSGQQIDSTKPFFSQCEHNVYNLVCWSGTRPCGCV
jgi:FkbM family methyltransferase